MLVSELIEQYIEYLLKQRNYSKNTARAYETDLGYFNEWLLAQNKADITDMENLKLYELRAFWAFRRSSNLSQQSMRRGQSAMRGLYAYALRQRLIRLNPAELMESPKRQLPLPKALEPKETTTLLNAPNNKLSLLELRDRAIIELLYGSGLRVSEAIGVEIEQIDFDSEMIKVLGKGNKERLVPLTPVSLSSLKDYLSARNSINIYKNEKKIFLNRYGKPISARSVARMLDKYARREAVMKNVSPHKLRHSFATDLLNNGADIRAVQAMLGHESLSTTKIYTRISKQKLLQTYKLSHPRSGDKK